MRRAWCLAGIMLLSFLLRAQQAQEPAVLDSVAAIVNNSVILESDLDEEMRFAAFEPFTVPKGEDSRQAAMQRLIDRALVEQQVSQQPKTAPVTDADVVKQITQLRETLPDCAAADCKSGQGWEKFCTAHGFSPEEVFARWKQRMNLLQFIEVRFRTGIRISQAEVEDYYGKEFVPVFQKKGLSAPPLKDVGDRIREILLQQRVNVLLNQWLQSLRDQGDVRVLNPADAPPPAAASGTGGAA